jgi:hypothetical protein
MPTEAGTLKRILLAATTLKARLFRNQTGTYALKDGRFLSSGLCVGSSDLIGWTTLEVTPAHVGRTFAIFTAIEVKGPTGRARPAQQQFLAAVAEAGGFCGFARSVEDAVLIMRDEWGATSLRHQPRPTARLISTKPPR